MSKKITKLSKELKKKVQNSKNNLKIKITFLKQSKVFFRKKGVILIVIIAFLFTLLHHIHVKISTCHPVLEHLNRQIAGLDRVLRDVW